MKWGTFWRLTGIFTAFLGGGTGIVLGLRALEKVIGTGWAVALFFVVLVVGVSAAIAAMEAKAERDAKNGYEYW